MSSDTLMFSRESLKSLQRCQRYLFKSSLENTYEFIHINYHYHFKDAILLLWTQSHCVEKHENYYTEKKSYFFFLLEF